MTPSTMALPPLSEFRPSVSWSISQAIGSPKTMIISRPAMIEVKSGITITGIRPRAQVGTFQVLIQCAITPASTPPMMAPMKPVTGSETGLSPEVWTLKMLPARPPITKPGAMPGRSAIA